MDIVGWSKWGSGAHIIGRGVPQDHLAGGAAAGHHVGHGRIDLEGAHFHGRLQDAVRLYQVGKGPNEHSMLSTKPTRMCACHSDCFLQAQEICLAIAEEGYRADERSMSR